MTVLEEGLVPLVIGDATIAGMVGDRMSPEQPDEGGVLPAISYLLVSKPTEALTHDNKGGGGTTLRAPRYQLEAWAADPLGAFQLAQAIAALLQGWAGTLGGFRVDRVTIENETDSPEPDTHLHRRIVDVVLRYEEAS